MATFILNPYNGDINLSNKEERKLYNTGCTGVKKEQRFDRSKERFSDFQKLIGHQMNNLCMMEILDVTVAWDAATTAPQNLNKVVNAFESQGIMRAQVEGQANLVWAMTMHGRAANKTPNYFKMFGVLPIDVVVPRNQRKLRQ
eukprot:8119336-Ditylum_brightwellii.AAC.1